MVSQLNAALINTMFAFFINVVFNGAMETKSPAVEADCQLIDDLGGPATVARLLGYDSINGTQRVSNWKTRGIPPAVKIERPDLFLRNLVREESAKESV